VYNKFTEMSKDIAAANKCLALDLPSAAVFHLMRVTEAGICRLAKRLKVPQRKVKHKTWDTILREINGAISALSTLPSLSPKKRKLRDRAAEATAHLNNVRIAWRNPVMHSERLYDSAEAEDIFQNVKAFTNYLAAEVL
jgi:hypothetical protein